MVVNAASEKPLPIMATTERKEVKARREEKAFMIMVKEQTLGRSFLLPQVQEGRRFNALTDKIGSFIVLELLPPKSGSVSLVTTSSWRS